MFTEDWFSDNTMHLNFILGHFKGKKGLSMLEIGCFEGRSTLWFLENLLTDPEAKILCIDTFDGRGSEEEKQHGPLEERFLNNVSAHAPKVSMIKSGSQEALRTVTRTFDIAFIDGSHTSPDVLEDAVLTLRRMNPGGIIVFDDYAWKSYEGTLSHPKDGIDAFVAIYAEKVKLIHKDYLVCVKVL